MEKDLPELKNLQYLKNLQLQQYSADVFGSYARLPILGLIQELTPHVNEEVFYGGKISSILEFDRGNTHKEIVKIETSFMIDQINPGERLRQFVRLDSPRWNIVTVAIKSAREELGL